MSRKSPQTEVLLSADETAAALGISKATLYRKEKAGLVPAGIRNPLNGRTFWRLSDIEAAKASWPTKPRDVRQLVEASLASRGVS